MRRPQQRDNAESRHHPEGAQKCVTAADNPAEAECRSVGRSARGLKWAGMQVNAVIEAVTNICCSAAYYEVTQEEYLCSLLLARLDLMNERWVLCIS